MKKEDYNLFFNHQKVIFNFFIFKYVIKSIVKNPRRTFVSLFAIIIAVSLTTTFFMWIESSPRLAIQSAMSDRSFEMSIHYTIYGYNNSLFDEMKKELPVNETLIESIYSVQPTIFLYNLNDRPDNFYWFGPNQNATDFYISENNRMAAFIVDDGFEKHIENQVTLSSSNDRFNVSDGVLISKRLLRRLEETTNRTYKVGDKIDFGIATRLADPERGEVTLRYWRRINLYNLTINAIFDRKVQRNLIYPTFAPETLGDGIIISKNLFNKSVIKELEFWVFTPTLFVRVDRTELMNLEIFQIKDEIEALAFRIETQSVWVFVRLYIDDINLILNTYSNSRIVILFIFIPLIIVSLLFFYVIINHSFGQRTNEVKLLRLRGATFGWILTVFVTEFLLLSIVGVSVGVLAGIMLTLAISTSKVFLVFDIEKIHPNFLTTVLKSYQTWMFSGILIGLIFIFIAVQRTRKLLSDLQENLLPKILISTRKRLFKKKFDGFILVLTIGISILIMSSDIINQLAIDEQLMGFYLATVVLLWLFFSLRLTYLGSDFLPKIGKITKSVFKAKSSVITSNIVRKRTQVITIIFLIILTTSLAFFSLFYVETIRLNTERNYNYMVGSDFKVFTEETSLNSADVYASIDGIDKVSPLVQITGDLGSYAITMIGVDPLPYYSVCYWDESSVIIGGSPAELMVKLDSLNSPGILINEFLATRLHLTIGDKLNVSRLLGTIGEEFSFTVIGVLRSAPAIGKLYSPSQDTRSYSKNGGIVLINMNLMELFGVTTTKIFLLKMTDDSSDRKSSWANIRQSIIDVPMTRQVIDLCGDKEYYFEFLKVAGVAGILTIDFGISILICSIGVGLFYSFLLDQRLKEYAILRACGGKRNDIYFIAISEALIIIVFGLLFGTIIGIIFSIGFMFITKSNIVSQENVFPLELSASPFLVIVALVIEFILLMGVIMVTAKKTRNVEVANLLRNL